MFVKSSDPYFAGRIVSVWLSSYEGLDHCDVATFFQGLYVTGEIAIRETEGLLEFIEADLILYHQDAHDTESDLILEGLV